MEQTPTIPENCQWAIFLRNHDELTLEMVTDEDRDYMYREYAEDPRMRLNLGIRRRLAPLMNNGRRQMELLSALLLSLPGSPVLLSRFSVNRNFEGAEFVGKRRS
jgi:maltose alpha-D-glucosyltransferase/alpha-amylase